MSNSVDTNGSRVAVDLSDPKLYLGGEPEKIWARLRAESPVYRNKRPGGDFWAVMTHDLINEVLRDNRLTSEKGMRLDENPAAIAAAAGKMLPISDPPRHGKIRGVINSAFTPRMVRRLEMNMQKTAAESVEMALSASECDMPKIASRLPLFTICDMLGLPREDWDFMLDRTMTAFKAVPGADIAGVMKAHAEILDYYVKLMELRRREPDESIVSALVHGELDGRPLTDEEIFLNCDALISGGNETTRHAITGGLLAFINNPAEWRRLQDDPELLPGAVQEVLRFASPAMHVMRTATVDMEIGGEKIAAGEQVAMWIPSGNRDERVFSDPDRFDITRRPNRHLTFAQGAHFCLGSALATTELTVMFGELIRKVGRAELAGEPRRMRSNLIWGFESLPVTLTRR